MKGQHLGLLAAVAVLPATVGTACLGGSSQRAVEGPVVQQWAVSHGPGLSSDTVALDADGNVYAAGSSDRPERDYIVVKYDAEGNEVWVARYNGSADAHDDPKAIAVDAAGNVYVAGTINQTGLHGTTGDYGTVKYDANGVKQWVAIYSGPGDGADRAWALALDREGNVYVSGFSYGGDETEDDFATIKYDGEGNELWVARYDGPFSGSDHAWAMTVDGSGSVFVTGGSYSDSNRAGDYLTVKYGTDGLQQWAARYYGPPGSDATATAVAVDDTGNVYVTGWVTSSSNVLSPDTDYATVKYDAQGEELWVALYDGPQRAGDRAEDVVVDSGGNVYVTGSSDDLASKGPDYATIKYDAQGNELWVARYSGPGHRSLLDSDYDDEARDLALDGAGNVYVTGYSRIDGSGLDWVTIKYNTEGEQLWLARYDGGDKAHDRAHAVAVDDSGNVCVAGQAGPDGFTVVKYSQD